MQGIQNFRSITASKLAIEVLAAVAFWIVGRRLIGRVIAVTQAAMNRNLVDPTLTKYPGSIVAIALNPERYARQLRRRRIHAGAAPVQGR
jgi:small conductance mechanosensitive channel